jgi:Protein of unknown function (DUF2569)
MSDDPPGARNPYEPPAAPLDLAPAAPTPAAVAPIGPAGIGGWLLLPLLGLIVSPMRVAAESVKTFSPLFQDGVSGFAGVVAANGPLGALLVFELAANVALFVYPLSILPFFFRRSWRVPTLMIAWYAAMAVINTVDLLWVTALDSGDFDTAAGGREVFRSMVGAAIWIPYFIKSVRVRNTFVK